MFMEKELRKLVRSIIRESMSEVGKINELDVDWVHVKERLEDRIMRPFLEVGFEEGTPTSKALNYTIVGTHSISSQARDEIKEKLEKLNDKRVRLPKGKTYGIYLKDVFIDPKTVKYYSEEDRVKSKGKTLVYIATTEDSYSVGNQVWAATSDAGSTELKTLMLRRNYFPPEKDARWDVSIKNINRILPPDLQS